MDWIDIFRFAFGIAGQCHIVRLPSHSSRTGCRTGSTPILLTDMFAFLRHRSSLVALLLLVLQLGIVAHRIEHYLEPEHMECGEDACAALTPVPDPPALPIVIKVPTQVAFAVRFWTASDAIVARPSDLLGFRSQAPPV